MSGVPVHLRGESHDAGLCGGGDPRNDDFTAQVQRATCEPCLVALSWAGIYAMERLTEVLRSKT